MCAFALPASLSLSRAEMIKRRLQIIPDGGTKVSVRFDTFDTRVGKYICMSQRNNILVGLRGTRPLTSPFPGIEPICRSVQNPLTTSPRLYRNFSGVNSTGHVTVLPRAILCSVERELREVCGETRLLLDPTFVPYALAGGS